MTNNLEQHNHTFNKLVYLFSINFFKLKRGSKSTFLLKCVHVFLLVQVGHQDLGFKVNRACITLSLSNIYVLGS